MIRPIHTATDHKAALAEIERLWNAEPGTDDGDRFEVLSVLVDVYEREHHPIDPPNPIDAILFRLDQMGMPTSFLEKFIGPRTRVWEVLNRKRGLSLPMIRRLNTELKIPAEVLVVDYKHEKPKAKREKPRVKRAERVNV
jgi:HTH-type transcriptional regulator/antitoxin HigA